MTLLHLTHAAFHTLRISLPTLLESALGAFSIEKSDRRLASWANALLSYAEVELNVAGLERAPLNEAFVVMSNHQSHYDIPVLFEALAPRRLRMVAKSELFRIPLWAAAMRVAGFVELERSDRRAAIASLSGARAAIQHGTSIWIAPEGTRSVSGELGSFKKGGFHLAEGAGARILPVSIDGTRRILPAGGRSVHNGVSVNVKVHDPVSPEDYAPERRDELVELVRQQIASGLSGRRRSALTR